MNIKRLVLGTAAGALAVTGAQAADLPVVVEPVEYVRICDAYGVGYYYIPGTETCLRVAGRVRVDYQFFGDLDDFSNGAELLGSRGYDEDADRGYRFRARAYLYMDSRTSTEFGLLRTFTELQAQFQDGSAFNGIDVERAFIQFGGLTFGNTSSFYNFGDAIYGSQFFWDVPASNQHTAVLAYTAAFGNGFSASIAIEDSFRRRRRQDATGFGGGETAYPTMLGNIGVTQDAWVPDLVANVRVDQGWGSAQIMGALGLITGGSGFNGNGDLINSETKVGFAIGGGVTVNIPFGNNSSIGIQGSYAHGLVSYVVADDNGYAGTLAAAVLDNSNNIELANAFSIAGGFSTSFTPALSYSLGGGYVHVDYDDTPLLIDSMDSFTVDGVLSYEIVSGFVFQGGLQYRYVDTDGNGDASALAGFLRAQRSF